MAELNCIVLLNLYALCQAHANIIQPSLFVKKIGLLQAMRIFALYFDNRINCLFPRILVSYKRYFFL